MALRVSAEGGITMLVRRKSSHAPTQLVLQFGLKPGRDRMHRAPKTSEVRDRAVNAGIRSGDERRHAFELARTEIMLRVGHRRELERGLSTWLGKILRRQRQCRIAPRARLHRGFTFRFWFAFAVNPALAALRANPDGDFVFRFAFVFVAICFSSPFRPCIKSCVSSSGHSCL